MTKEGVLAVTRHRKALLQVLMSAVAPERAPECNMHDWAAGAGGKVFTNIIEQLFTEDHGLGDMLEVLCERTFHDTCTPCRAEHHKTGTTHTKYPSHLRVRRCCAQASHWHSMQP